MDSSAGALEKTWDVLDHSVSTALSKTAGLRVDGDEPRLTDGHDFVPAIEKEEHEYITNFGRDAVPDSSHGDVLPAAV